MIMNAKDTKELYLEIMDFLYLSGGNYQHLDLDTFKDVLDALLEDRYRLIRDEVGKIVSFTSWWMIRREDMELVKNGSQRPSISGPIVYIADHAGRCSYSTISKFLRETAGVQGVCWHHKWKRPELFRCFRLKEA